jgi:hypothetical protein
VGSQLTRVLCMGMGAMKGLMKKHAGSLEPEVTRGRVRSLLACQLANCVWRSCPASASARPGCFVEHHRFSLPPSPVLTQSLRNRVCRQGRQSWTRKRTAATNLHTPRRRAPRASRTSPHRQTAASGCPAETCAFTAALTELYTTACMQLLRHSKQQCSALLCLRQCLCRT